MKITRSSTIQSLVLAVTLGIGLGFTSPVSAQAHAYIVAYNAKELTDLGTLGGSDSAAFGINEAVRVVGWSNTAAGDRRAFTTGPNGLGMTDLGTLGGSFSSAYGIKRCLSSLAAARDKAQQT